MAPDTTLPDDSATVVRVSSRDNIDGADVVRQVISASTPSGITPADITSVELLSSSTNSNAPETTHPDRDTSESEQSGTVARALSQQQQKQGQQQQQGQQAYDNSDLRENSRGCVYIPNVRRCLVTLHLTAPEQTTPLTPPSLGNQQRLPHT